MYDVICCALTYTMHTTSQQLVMCMHTSQYAYTLLNLSSYYQLVRVYYHTCLLYTSRTRHGFKNSQSSHLLLLASTTSSSVLLYSYEKVANLRARMHTTSQYPYELVLLLLWHSYSRSITMHSTQYQYAYVTWIGIYRRAL